MKIKKVQAFKIRTGTASVLRHKDAPPPSKYYGLQCRGPQMLIRDILGIEQPKRSRAKLVKLEKFGII